MEKKRLFYLDNVRVALTVLVIAHHVGQAYGPTGGWWHIREPLGSDLLAPFFTVNRSFFMSLFFMVSGYFLAPSFDRGGARKFTRSRLLRLGVPLLFFAFLVIPLQHYSYYLNYRGYEPISFGSYYTDVYLGLGQEPAGWTGPAWPELNFGHLWYLEHLLIFSLIFALVRLLARKPLIKDEPEGSIPSDLTIAAVALGLAVVTGIVRIWYPIDRWEGFLGFIQVAWADVPRDLGFFLLGILAYRKNWFARFPTQRGYRWLLVGVGLGALWYILRLGLVDVLPLAGLGFDIFYLIWEQFLCFGMCIGLVVLFRERFNTQGSFGKSLAGAQYGAYLFHVLIVVILQSLILSLNLAPIVKFGLVTLAAVPLVFTFSIALRQVSWVRKII